MTSLPTSPARLRAAGFVPGKELTVLIGLAAELATVPVVPGGVVLRWVTADGDMHRIDALQSAVWGPDWGGLGEDLIRRIAAAPDDIAVLAAEAPVLRHLGFRAVTTTTEYVWTPQPASPTMTQAAGT
jgi:hypothetical protein